MTPRESYIQEPQRFGRKWWGRSLRSLFWVALSTVLVWVYADMEFTEEREFRVTIRLHTGTSENLVLTAGNELKVVFVLSGPRNNLERFRSQLNARGSIVEFDVSQRFTPADTGIPVEDILRRGAGTAKAGLTFVSASPNVVPLNLDVRLHLPNVPVKLNYTGATLAGPVETARTDVFVARSQWERIVRLLRGRDATLETEVVNLRNYPTDKPAVVKATIIPSIASLPVQVSPSVVEFTVLVGQRTGEKEFTIAVRSLAPPGWMEDGTWQRYKFVRADSVEWRPKITVSGAKADLDKLKPTDIDAYIELREDDKKPVDSWLTRPVTVRFPDGANVRLAGDAPTVRFRLEEIPPAP